jgi:outer membrane protein assembly complex protein YaeT
MMATDRWTTRMRFAALALAGLLVCSVPLNAQAPGGKILVEDVIPQGNQQIPTQKIMGFIRTKPGSEYQPDVINEDVRRLYDSKLFANIQVRTRQSGENKIKIYFIVAEYPSTVKEVVYQGAKHIKPDELEKITGLRRGIPLNPIQSEMARQAILKHYHDEGRLFAGVELVEGNKPGDTRIVFNIAEGYKAKITSIDFVGHTFVSGAVLRQHIDSSRAFLGIGGTYRPMEVDHDVAQLEQYYKSFGFFDIRVDRELIWDEKQKGVQLIFHIHEGRRYVVTKIQVDGNSSLDSPLLMTGLKQASGAYYVKSDVDNDVKNIQNTYGYRGEGVTVREQDFYPAPGEVAVHYEVQERAPSKVGTIKIVGNDVTKDRVILRQIPLYPGQILTYPDLRVAEANLARLNIFEMKPEQGIRPTVTVIDPDIPAEFKDVLVNVKETMTGSLMFGVGVNSDAGLVGSIVLNERNFDITNFPTSFEDLLSGRAFRGAGQEFRIEALPGTQLQRYSVSWREPSLFDSPYSLQVSAYYFDYIYNEYTESRLGTRWTLARQLNKYWKVSGSVRLEDVGVHNVPDYEPEQIQVDTGQHFQVGLGASVTRDTRDSYLRPTEGNQVTLSFEEFLGDFTFPKLDLTANQYFTTYQRADGSGRHVLALHSELSWAGSNTPVYERFYAGGFASMRGFEFRGVGPFINGFNIGGDFQWLNSVEYQIPILANDHLYSVFFVDSGTVESTTEIRDYRVAAGFGLRIQVPMLGPVPIALDFGFPIVKGPEDKTQVFSFWVGFFH